MKNLFAPFRWHTLLRWSPFVGQHGFDFSAKTFFIKLECSLALAVESKVRIQLHGALLSPLGAGTTSSVFFSCADCTRRRSSFIMSKFSGGPPSLLGRNRTMRTNHLVLR